MALTELLLTVDVEPDWGCEGVRAVQEALPRLLELLDACRARATFFVVAELVDRCEAPIRQAAARHEIASHGWRHVLLHRLSPERIEEELIASRRRLEALGARVLGFRAPWFRTPPGWAGYLRQAGYCYDASAGRCYPSPHNVPSRGWRVRREGGVLRLPVSTLRDGLTPFCLTWLRLLAPMGERMIDPRARMFYLHLHELLPPSSAAVLPPWRRIALRRNAGERAWEILRRLLEARGGATRTCAEYLGVSEAVA